MSRVYVSPDYIDQLVTNDSSLNLFFSRLHQLLNFFLSQKINWDCKIVIDFERIQSLSELNIYDVRILNSLLLDSKTIFESPKSFCQAKDYAYHKISLSSLSETTDHSYIAISEFDSSDSMVVEPDNRGIAVLRTHRFDFKVRPVLKTFDSIDIRNIEVEFFLRQYLVNEISNEAELVTFRDALVSFTRDFDWLTWKPNLDPVPAHQIAGLLQKYFQRSNNDTQILKWGYIMAFVNGARFNKKLTSHNKDNRKVNDVFQQGTDKGNHTIFFSIDTENGMLEVYDYRGLHLNKVYGLTTGLKHQERDYKISVPKDLWL